MVKLKQLSYVKVTKEKKNDLVNPPIGSSLRGSVVPVVIGTQVVSPVIGWVGHRTKYKMESSGGKGGQGGDTQYGYRESSLQYLCVGPATAISAIYDGGSLFYAPQEPLTPFNTPSGSDVFPYAKVKYVYTHTGLRGYTLEIEQKIVENRRKGYFTVYWGDHFVDGVPVDSELAQYAGTESILPGVCYIIWKQVTLGPSPNWPAYTYEVSTTPYETEYNALAIYSQGNIVRFNGKLYWYKHNTPTSGMTPDIYPAYWYLMDTNAGLVSAKTTIKHDVDTAPVWDKTTVYAKWDRVRSTDAADLFTYIYINDYPYANKPIKTKGFVNKDYWAVYRGADGINPASVIKQLLSAPHPYGASLPEEMVDTTSLETAGALFATEKLAFNTLIEDGDDAGSILENILEDATCFLAYDKGKLILVPLRANPTVNEFNSTDTDEGLVFISPKPSGTHVSNTLARNRVYYLYKNRHDAYTDTDINFDAGSLESMTIYSVPDEKTMDNVTDGAVADLVAQRRYLIDSRNVSEYEIEGGRILRGLRPGHVVYFPSLPEALRVINVSISLSDGGVSVEAIGDVYDTEVSPYKTPGDHTGGEASYTSEPDIFLAAYELPYALNKEETNAIIVLRQRANELIAGTVLRGTPSIDDDTYTQIQVQDTLVSVAGSLAEDISDSDPFIIPSVKLYASNFFSDIATLPDLSGQSFKYNTGEVLVWINNEIFFFHSFSLVAGEPDAILLNNLIRARYDTARQYHSSGSAVFFVRKTDLLPIVHNTIVTNSPYYICSQPYTATDQLPLADAYANEVSTQIIGRAANPLPCLNFRVNNGRYYYPGGALLFTWDYQVKHGNGTTPDELLAGEPLLNTIPGPEGVFKLSFYDTGVKIHEVITPDTSYELTNLGLINIFGGEPDSLSVTLASVLDQRESYITVLDIIRDESGSVLDTTPPQPNPIGWEILPTATGSDSISMTCAEATDHSGVEYYFECIDGPDLHNSGWQASRVWEDTSLRPNTKYTYRVRTRDLSPSLNLGEWSESFYAYTNLSSADRPLTWMGLYDPLTQYQVNDIVAYDPAGDGKLQSYIVTTQPPAPGYVPTNALYWDIMTAYGSDGNQGDQGVGGSGVVEIYYRSLTTPSVPTSAFLNINGSVSGLGLWSRNRSTAAGVGYLWCSTAIIANMPPVSVALTFNYPIKEELGQQRFIYRNAATQPATPTATVPSGWALTPTTPPSGQFTWFSVATFTTDNYMVTTWSAPSRLSGEQGPAGSAGADGAMSAAFPIPKGFNWRTESGYLRWDAGTITFGNKVFNLSANTGNQISAPSEGVIYFIVNCDAAAHSTAYAINTTVNQANQSIVFTYHNNQTNAKIGNGRWVVAMYVQQGVTMVWDTGVFATFGNYHHLTANNIVVNNTAQIKDAVIATAKIQDLAVDTIKIADRAVSLEETFTLSGMSSPYSYLRSRGVIYPYSPSPAYHMLVLSNMTMFSNADSANITYHAASFLASDQAMMNMTQYNNVNLTISSGTVLLLSIPGSPLNISFSALFNGLLWYTTGSASYIISYSIDATGVTYPTVSGQTATRLSLSRKTRGDTLTGGTLRVIPVGTYPCKNEGVNVPFNMIEQRNIIRPAERHSFSGISRAQSPKALFLRAGHVGTSSDYASVLSSFIETYTLVLKK